MTDPQIGMLMLGLFIFIIMLGFPIAFTLMAMGVGFGFYAYYTPGQEIFDNRIFTLLVQKTFEVTSNDVLIAVPLFLFMGYLVERANILDRLFHSLQISMKNVPGALAVATLVDLRDVRDRDRHRRRGRDADGAAGASRPCCAPATTSSCRPAWSAPAAVSAS